MNNKLKDELSVELTKEEIKKQKLKEYNKKYCHNINIL